MGDAGLQGQESQTQRASLPTANPTRSLWQTSYPNPMVNYRSTVDLPAKSDIIIIGSGITGAFIARELLQSSKDLKLLVLEARTTCSGATGRNGGHLLPLVHEQSSNIVDFETRNFAHVEELITKYEVPCDFRKLSGCIAFWNKTYFEEAKEALGKSKTTEPKHAALVRVVEDPEELQDLRLQDAVGAIVQSMAATLSPYKLITWMWQDMVERFPTRLNLQTNTPVLKLSKRSQENLVRSIDTDRGEVSAHNIILATNGYTSHLLPQFEAAITPTQAQMSALRPPSSFSNRLLDQSYGFFGVGFQDRVMSDYLVQGPLDQGGHLMYGGGRAEVAEHGVGVSDDSYVDPDAEKYLRHLPERLNLSSRAPNESKLVSQMLEIDASWTGIMGYSSDHFPWVGAVPDDQGLWLCGGYTGHGMPNASGCGNHVARLVLAATDSKDWRVVEEQAIKARSIPKEYIITKERLEK